MHSFSEKLNPAIPTFFFSVVAITSLLLCFYMLTHGDSYFVHQWTVRAGIDRRATDREMHRPRVLAVAMPAFSGSSCFGGHPLCRNGINKSHVIQHLIERAFGAFVVERTHLDPGSQAANGMPADRFGWGIERYDPLFSTCHDVPPSMLI
jgi:hypothetical protein